MKLYLIIFVIQLFLYKVFSFSDFTYKAAVLEYSPNFDHGDGPERIFKRSVADYEQYIKEAASQKVDIIVFPEDGLTGLTVPPNRNKIWAYSTKVPNPIEQISPCDSAVKFSNHLKRISCAAAANKIYVAVNLVENYDCKTESNCPGDGVFYYNTNVVFDRNGVVIARYRKFNLFVEPGFDITEKPELITFKTDFNVTFGMFICFDILFKSPAVNLVKMKNVHDIIYSTAWFSELPFLTAVQTQTGWAYGNDVTLLASGYNNPKNKNSGSGIYVGKAGALTQIFPLARQNKMLIADVPKYPFYDQFKTLKERIASKDNNNANEMSNDEITFIQEKLTQFTTEIIDDNKFNKEICNGQLCCKFEINSIPTNNSPYIYRAVVFDGIRVYSNIVNAGTRVCGIINCLNEKLESCGSRNRTLITGRKFKNIKIRGDNFRQTDNTLFWPATLNSKILSIDPLYFKYVNSMDQSKQIHLELLNEMDDLLTFSIYGRDFSLDSRVKLNDEQLESILMASGIKSKTVLMVK